MVCMWNGLRLAEVINIYAEIRLLQTEIEQLEGLAVNMKSDLDELERGRAKSRFSQTWKGRIWGVVDKIFAMYCIYKLIVVGSSVYTSQDLSTSANHDH